MNKNASCLKNQQYKTDRENNSQQQKLQQPNSPLQPSSSSSTRKNVKKTKEKEKASSWNAEENLKYLQFLKEQKDLLTLTLNERRQIGIHNIMSTYIKTKNSRQCRSHHQKMLLKYKNVKGILQNLSPKRSSSQPCLINFFQFEGKKQISLFDSLLNISEDNTRF